MSKGRTLRALVNERLAAAAEEIFVLIERTIAEYEEELCRSRKENQRKQQLLDQVLSPRIELIRGNVQIPSAGPGPGLNQDITETPWIKEELAVSVPESSAVCVKTEESSLLQQRQAEHREETQGEDISSETHFLSEPEGHNDSSDTDNDDDWGPFTQMETEADGDQCVQVQIGDRSTELSPQNKSGPETTVHSGHVSGAEGGERKKHQCHVCNKRFRSKQDLQRHNTVHTGERPYSCPICDKTFAQKRNRDSHLSTHTGDKPYSCLTCQKSFVHVTHLNRHIRTHTGDKPYMCLACGKTFTQKNILDSHVRTHTGEKPYSCSMCKKTFARKGHRDLHARTHTGEKPYSCSYCNKHFADSSTLRRHVRIHTGEKPYSCLACDKTFTQKCSLKSHIRTHTGEKPFGCLICNKEFAQKYQLSVHMRTHSI